jgi:hypothetical protein
MQPRTKEEQVELHKKALKLMASLQLSLELMDDLKYTTVYKHKIRNQINQLEKSLERFLFDPLKSIDTLEKEETFVSIQNSISIILEARVEDLFDSAEVKLK